MSPARIYIVGFMGSGKTTVGRKLASILGWDFIDLDKQIEINKGMSIPRIFSELGEDQFRKTESEMLRGTSKLAGAVVSTGGGAPCHDENMDFMIHAGITLYLKLTPEQLRSRLIHSKTERPLIKDLNEDALLEFIKNKLTQREEFYSRAEIILEGCDVDIRHLEEILRPLIQ